jgi:hypothetical protein
MARSSVEPVGLVKATPAAPARLPGWKKQWRPYGSQIRPERARKIRVAIRPPFSVLETANLEQAGAAQRGLSKNTYGVEKSLNSK